MGGISISLLGQPTLWAVAPFYMSNIAHLPGDCKKFLNEPQPFAFLIKKAHNRQELVLLFQTTSRVKQAKQMM